MIKTVYRSKAVLLSIVFFFLSAVTLMNIMGNTIVTLSSFSNKDREIKDDTSFQYDFPVQANEGPAQKKLSEQEAHQLRKAQEQSKDALAQNQTAHLMKDPWAQNKTDHSMMEDHLAQNQTTHLMDEDQSAQGDDVQKVHTIPVYNIISYKRPLNLVFVNINPLPVDVGGSIYEADWIQTTIFGHLDRPVRVRHTMDPAVNDTVYIMMFGPPSETFFSSLRNQGIRNIGVLYMGDEKLEHDADKLYKLSERPDYVLRNYWSPRFTKDSLYALLGTRTGLGTAIGTQTLLPASRRQYIASFVGSMRRNRAEMLEHFKYRRSESYISADKEWGSTEGIHPFHYRSILWESKFVLCPFGNNEESVRFYEALESGAIPIVQQSQMGDGADFVCDGIDYYYTKNRNSTDGKDMKCPVLRVSKWEELDGLLQYYDERPEEMDALQANVVRWWLRVKTQFVEQVREIVDRSFEEYYGPGT